ncbi:MAG: hypothetical protein KJ023_09115, partial [Burkholderiaceae bacterium]|nr:hypothetical protein [Burkholderiaceae bacterium]
RGWLGARGAGQRGDDMTEENTDDPGRDAPAIDSQAGFTAAILWGFERAMREGGRTRRIVCVDRDFAQWPLDTPALLDALTAWLKRGAHRQLVLLAATYDEMPRRHPRFVGWRRHFAHVVSPYGAPEDAAATLPTLLLDDDGTLVRLIDPVHWRGRASADERSVLPWREQIDALLQRSEAAFPVQSLGL